MVYVQGSPFIIVCLGSIGMDCVITEVCYKRQFYKGIIQRNYNSFVKFHGKILLKPHMTVLYTYLFYIESAIKGLYGRCTSIRGSSRNRGMTEKKPSFIYS